MKELDSYLSSKGLKAESISIDDYRTLELLFFNYQRYSRMKVSFMNGNNLDKKSSSSFYVNADGYEKLLNNYINNLLNRKSPRKRTDLQN